MKVLIINGSPKGEYSITLHTALFLEKKFPQCKFEIIHVGKKIKFFEYVLWQIQGAKYKIIDKSKRVVVVLIAKMIIRHLQKR